MAGLVLQLDGFLPLWRLPQCAVSTLLNQSLSSKLQSTKQHRCMRPAHIPTHTHTTHIYRCANAHMNQMKSKNRRIAPMASVKTSGD